MEFVSVGGFFFLGFFTKTPGLSIKNVNGGGTRTRTRKTRSGGGRFAISLYPPYPVYFSDFSKKAQHLRRGNLMRSIDIAKPLL